MKNWSKKNGLTYKLILESEDVHLYEVDNGNSYEVAELVLQNKDSLIRKAGKYLPSNERFGTSGNKSRVFYNEKTAVKYYNELNREINERQRISRESS